MKALWHGEVIAENDETIVIEGNHYFPPESVKKEYLEASSKRTTCPWKGEASYYSIRAGSDFNKDAAWYYPEPKSAASKIKNYIAFWNGIQFKE